MGRKPTKTPVLVSDRPSPFNLYPCTYVHDKTLSYTPPHKSPSRSYPQIVRSAVLPFKCARCNEQLINCQALDFIPTKRYILTRCGCISGGEMYVTYQELLAAFETPPPEPLERVWINPGLKCYQCADHATWVCNEDWGCICMWCHRHKTEGMFELDNPNAPKIVATKPRKAKTVDSAMSPKRRGRPPKKK